MAWHWHAADKCTDSINDHGHHFSGTSFAKFHGAICEIPRHCYISRDQGVTVFHIIYEVCHSNQDGYMHVTPDPAAPDEKAAKRHL